MTRPSFEKEPQPWRCDSCGAVNYSTRHKRCAACWSPAPVVRERQSATRRTVLISGLVTGAAFLAGGGYRAVSSLLSKQSQPQPGQAIWEISLGSGSTLSGSGDGVPAIAWSPDGTKIACIAMVGKPANIGVMVVDAKTAETKWTHQEALDTITWSPDGTLLALAGSGRPSPAYPTPRPPFIQIWQVQGWQKVVEYAAPNGGSCIQLAWSPDGTRLAGFNKGDSQGSQSVQIWKAHDGEPLFRQKAMSQNLLLSWLPDSHTLATSQQQGELDIWNANTGENLFHREPDVPWASYSTGGKLQLFLTGPDAAFSPDGQRIAFYVIEQDQLVIQIWDLRTASRIFSCQPVAGQHWNLTWSPDGTYLAACQSNSSPTSIRFWDATTGKLAFSYEAVSNRFTWSPDGRFLAVVDSQPSFVFRGLPSSFGLWVLEVR